MFNLDGCVQKYDGFPLGSLVLYATDDSGRPILVISSLSPHTKVNCNLYALWMVRVEQWLCLPLFAAKFLWRKSVHYFQSEFMNGFSYFSTRIGSMLTRPSWLPLRYNTLSNCVILQDLETNPKCSLLVARDAGDISDTVVTIIGDAEMVSQIV